jgi:hypothetical protein
MSLSLTGGRNNKTTKLASVRAPLQDKYNGCRDDHNGKICGDLGLKIAFLSIEYYFCFSNFLATPSEGDSIWANHTCCPH